MSLEELQKIKEEFEAINKSYKETFTHAGRLELLERFKRLSQYLRGVEEVKGIYEKT